MTCLCIQCSPCVALSVSLRDFANGVDSAATPLFAQIDSTKSAASSQIVSVKNQILTQISSARGDISSVRDKAASYQTNVQDYSDKVDKYETARRGVTLLLFLISLLLIVAWLVGTLIMKRETPTKVTSQCCGKRDKHAREEWDPWLMCVLSCCWRALSPVQFMFGLGTLMWLVFMVHLPFALLSADTCHYLDQKEPALDTVQGEKGARSKCAEFRSK
jgi:hypothetical protein